ncbi:hypothetical protein V2J09_023176 [Rumex salicifolius]
MLKEWDRVYDYAYYNDLGKPDKGEDYVRPVLGGSKEYPYPRRGRTGRKPTKTDPNTESRLPILNLDIYVPRDERFDEIKFSDFVAEGLKSIAQILVPKLKSIFENTHNEFDSFEDVQKLYEGGFKLPSTINKVLGNVPCEFLHTEGVSLFKLPMPDVIKGIEIRCGMCLHGQHCTPDNPATLELLFGLITELVENQPFLLVAQYIRSWNWFWFEDTNVLSSQRI